MTQGYNGQVGSMVQNSASGDKFIAPDSTSKRPTPESMTDRPRSPQQTPETAIESNLNCDQE